MDILRKSPQIPPDPSRRYDEVIKVWSPGTLQSHHRSANGLICCCDQGISLHIECPAEGILRFRYALEGHFERDFSYAVLPPAFSAPAPFETEVTPLGIWLKTLGLQIFIEKSGLRTTIFDAEGHILLEDRKGFSAEIGILGGNLGVHMDKHSAEGTAYYGLGDKACAQDLRGKTFHQWCEDAFAFGEHTDQQYRAVPFFYALRENRAFGIFFDNTYRTRFELGVPELPQTKTNARDQRLAWSAEGGELNFYFLAGPTLSEVAVRYHRLTGIPELPPLWALGYHQCRWSYFPEKRVMAIARQFRELDIPCDAIWLDIDYMDGYRCFTWHPERFPDPAGLIRRLEAEGFRTVVMIDPGIKVERDYAVYESGLEGGHFCRRSDGDVFRGPVWPGDCAFPDFTHPSARQWWAEQYVPFLEETGIHGVWNDMNEPAVFEIHRKTFPDAVLHHHEGAPCDHRRAHNVYGMLMSRATREGMQLARPETRPFVLSRASYSGGQRFAALWTGDNIASWEHLQIALQQCLRMALSGFSFCGTDIGGFIDRPDGELYVRWLQLGIFHPLMRTHSMGDHLSGDAAVDEAAYEARSHEHRMDQEPWAFGKKYLVHAREAIRLRYRLLPYLYSAFWEHTQDGLPIIRPVGFDENEPLSDKAFYFGKNLLVSPVLKPNQRLSKTALPKNTRWYALEAPHAVFEGGATAVMRTTLSTVPVWVRAGTVLPLAPAVSSTRENYDTLKMLIFVSDVPSESRFYEDDGEGYTHLDGSFRVSEWKLSPQPGKQWILERSIIGHFRPRYHQIELLFIGFSEGGATVVVDGSPVASSTDGQKILCTVPEDFRQAVISL